MQGIGSLAKQGFSDVSFVAGMTATTLRDIHDCHDCDASRH
jgi:hypothetical protein